MAPRSSYARDAARRLIEDHQVKSAPVPVEKIAKALGVRVQYAPLDGDLSGMAFIKDSVPIAGINSLHNPNRQRFTLAHELAHIRLHREELEKQVHIDKGSLRRDSMSAKGENDLEIEANAFASELLMPRELLNAALKGRTVDLEDSKLIESLARHFRVSEAALKFRLQVDE
ncbi:MAG: ImmA/IrrE family metallo-endopeptidase [Xanthobacteraceae bacterium]|jgi:Zn-dependent peptidase ImmA (M78 family)|nr:ImmA/IrrE family metallo-endopeptidase [Xanthobacteraceae bacterium]MBX3519583.1 ImmA/IrrE family metallo-endopeptidase [Xanthobacteraceae bacterium]MBX3549253.1 ImmA/IrrE family metallo-endopeptidase [Xanthobacteraceae bacterium]